jgi:hypothetical protein
VRPAYEAGAWQDGDWWYARVTAAGKGADPSPVGYLTQARSEGGVGRMARDLVATVLDADPGELDVTITVTDADPARGSAPS